MRSIVRRFIIIGILFALMFPPSALAARDHAEVLLGETLVFEAPYSGTRILVAVKVLSEAGIETPMVFFRFTAREPFKTSLETWIGLAEVKHTRNGLVIRGIDEDITFAFRMDGGRELAIGKNYIGRTIALNNGVELVLNRPPSSNTDKDSRLSASLEELAIDYGAWPVSVTGEHQAEFPMKDQQVCTAGGEGSTECSVACPTVAPIIPSSCSVTCGTGFHSCCYCWMMTAFCECRATPGSPDTPPVDNTCVEDCTPTSPILISTANGSYHLTSLANGVVFDLNADGEPEATAWTEEASDDAFLVFDRSGNGLIDDGTELFGDYTPQPPSEDPNGFLALAEWDLAVNGGNEDGKIDASDDIFPSLRLWIDENHNGASETNELFLLPSLDIQYVDLDYSESRRTDPFGNEFRFKSKVGKSHGIVMAWDVFFVH